MTNTRQLGEFKTPGTPAPCAICNEAAEYPSAAEGLRRVRLGLPPVMCSECLRVCAERAADRLDALLFEISAEARDCVILGCLIKAHVREVNRADGSTVTEPTGRVTIVVELGRAEQERESNGV